MAKPAAAGGAAASTDKKGKKKTFKKKERKHVPHGLVYVQASFNNTIVTITDMNGNVLSWKSSGSQGLPDHLVEEYSKIGEKPEVIVA